MENIKIVKAATADIVKLQEVSRHTFSEAFSDTNTEENMKHYLDHSLSTAKLAAELDNELSQFYFAIVDNEIVGYLKINTGQAQTELKDENALEIERIYVLRAYYGKNVAQLLYGQALAIANANKADYVWLGVWEKNARAISFYNKNGFVPFDQHAFMLGDDEQTDIMMKKIL